jgi:hypothetical protein
MMRTLFACSALAYAAVPATPAAPAANFGLRFEPQGAWVDSPRTTPRINGRTLEFASDCDEACCKARCEAFGPKYVVRGGGDY